MRHAILVVVCATLLATVAGAQGKPATAADEAVIKKDAEARIAAWNRHDGKAIAASYAADGDRVMPQGHFHGRAEIEKSYADRFLTVNKNATLTVDAASIHFLSPDAAVEDRDITITGRTDGTVKQHVTDIYIKRDGGWVLVMSRTIQMQ